MSAASQGLTLNLNLVLGASQSGMSAPARAWR